MNIAELLIEAYSRIPDGVARVLDGLDDAALAARPDAEANSIGWLLWHIARSQDSQVSAVADREELWLADGWAERFSLPFDDAATGYGQTSAEVGAFRADATDLRGYLGAVHRATTEFLATLAEEDLDRIVDESWNPAVTLGVRLVSIAADGLQHIGQAAYVRGMYERR
ncbi:mycothiol transferase [Georgenia sp.]